MKVKNVVVCKQKFTRKILKKWSSSLPLLIQLTPQIVFFVVVSQAYSQKFVMGGGGGNLGVWGQSPTPLEANGGLKAKPRAVGGWGSGGKVPRARKFCIFCKNSLILGLFY